MTKEINKVLTEHEVRIQRLEEMQQENRKTFARIEEKLNKHDEMLSDLQSDVTKLQSDMSSLHRSVLIIEDAVVNKIPALFDGYKMHQEKQEILESRVDNIEEKTQMNSIRISSLEIISNQNSEDIAKLIS